MAQPKMTNDAKQYDIVLSHDPDDCWALEWLLPRLEAAGFKMYVDQRDAAIGWPKSVNREQALKNSRHTLVVLTPRYLAGEWSMFEAFLAQSLNPSGRQRRLIPLLLEKCQLPAYFAHLEAADFTDPSRWEAEMARLVRNLSGNAEGVSHASAALSVDAVPAPATALPAGSRMSLRPNPFFTGRDADLRALAQAFTSSRTAVIATGIGGVGKTQLAAEFAHRYGQRFAGGVFWISFADPSGVDAAIAACGGAGALELYTDAAGLSLAEQVAKVRRAWDEDVPRLLIFDNCDDTKDTTAEQLLAAHRPISGGCRVLVTSRRGRWSRGQALTVHPLGAFSRPESIDLLRCYQPALGKAEAASIAKLLGDLPLALSLAGSYLEVYCDDPFGKPGEYYANLQRELLAHGSMAGAGSAPSPTLHEQSIRATFQLSFMRLDPAAPLDALALAALARAAQLAPGEPFPRELLHATLGEPTDDEAITRLRANALDRLIALGLLEVADNAVLRMHQLISVFANTMVVDHVEAENASREVVLAHICALVEANSVEQLQSLLVHLKQVAEIAVISIKNNTLPISVVIRQAQAFDTIGGFIVERADYATARKLFEASWHLWCIAKDELRCAATYNNLGQVAFYQGRLTEAEQYYNQSLQLYRALNNQHGVGILLCHLGILALDRCLYELAETQLREGIAILQQLDDQHSLAMYQTSLGDVYRYQGNLEQAVEIHTIALGRSRAQDDPWIIAAALESCGSDALLQNEIEHARQYFTEGLQLAREMHDSEGIICIIEGFVAVAYAQKQFNLANKLLFIADSEREALGAPRPCPEKHAYQEMKANIAVQPVENLSKENQVAEEKPILTLEQAINAIHFHLSI